MSQISAEVINESVVRKWKRYPAYKDSGVEWLGEIPEHWKVKPLKYIVKINSDVLAENTPSDYTLRYVDISNLDSNGSILEVQEMRFEDSPSRARRRVQQGDTIISTVRTYLRAITFISNPPENLIVSTGFAVLSPRGFLHPGFLFRLVQSQEFVEKVVAYSEGVGYPAINPSRLASLQTWLPPLLEQRAIASFLDRETAKIDTLIAKKEQLIQLLQEKRTALISHAVTKGLDPAAPMKDSGVEWLGKIPAHWEACQLKRIAEISYGLTLELDRTETEGTFILSLPNVTKEGQLILEEVPRTPLNTEEKKNLLLQKGDLLFNWRNGSSDHVGKTAYFDADGEYIHVSFLLRIRFDSKENDSRYYHRFLNNLRNTEFFASAKTRVNNTYNQEELRRLRVMVPPIEEQRAIASFLDCETAKIDALIAKICTGIEQMKEYRTAMISSAVTRQN